MEGYALNFYVSPENYRDLRIYKDAVSDRFLEQADLKLGDQLTYDEFMHTREDNHRLAEEEDINITIYSLANALGFEEPTIGNTEGYLDSGDYKEVLRESIEGENLQKSLVAKNYDWAAKADRSKLRDDLTAKIEVRRD